MSFGASGKSDPGLTHRQYERLAHQLDLKSKVTPEMPETCITFNGHQGAILIEWKQQDCDGEKQSN